MIDGVGWELTVSGANSELRKNKFTLNEAVENLIAGIIDELVILSTFTWHGCIQLLPVGGEVVIQLILGNDTAVNLCCNASHFTS